MKSLLAVAVLTLSAMAFADSVPVAVYQNGGTDSILLGVDFTPVIAPTFHGQLPGAGDVLCFGFTFLPDSGQDLPWSAAMELGGILYQATGLIAVQQGPFYIGSFAFDNLPAFYHGDFGQLEFWFGPQQYSRPLTFEYFTPVPEPGTWLLMMTGFGAILLWHRKVKACSTAS